MLEPEVDYASEVEVLKQIREGAAGRSGGYKVRQLQQKNRCDDSLTNK